MQAAALDPRTKKLLLENVQHNKVYDTVANLAESLYQNSEREDFSTEKTELRKRMTTRSREQCLWC